VLKLEDLRCAYGEALVLHGISFAVAPGEVLCLLGRNGAGKTTTLRAIMGLLRPQAGRIMLDGRELTALRPHQIPRLGIAYVPQGRRLFPLLTVRENLRMGLLVRGPGIGSSDSILELFPALRQHLERQAGTLSGGEQQMVATARALCAAPRYLLMDEPTEGLAPALVQTVLDTVRSLRSRGVGVLLVEQKIDAALSVADAVAVMEDGRVRLQAAPRDLAVDSEALLKYLGVRRSEPR
jgi:branched-chain amino acid transport system ATP-binding protein